MRKTMVGVAAAAVAAFATPVFAADLPLYPDSGGVYQRESQTYTYEREYRRAAPRVVAAPVVDEAIVVRRPVVVARPRVVIEEYPVYAAPVYAAPVFVGPRVFAYGGPGWRHRFWGPRGHFAGRW
jgi:hypothetical protein